MIDLDLIHKGIVQAQQNIIAAAQSALPRLIKVSDVFPTETIEKIRALIDQQDLPWTDANRQETLPRRQISWLPESVLEEIYETCHGLTPTINEIYPDTEKFFWGCTLWQDQAGYHLDWHTDNPDIDVSMQIYLFSTGAAPGTEFAIDNKAHLVPFIVNSGYISHNSGNDRLLHRVEYAVPTDTVRYSLYAVWSRIPKHMTNT